MAFARSFVDPSLDHCDVSGRQPFLADEFTVARLGLARRHRPPFVTVAICVARRRTSSKVNTLNGPEPSG